MLVNDVISVVATIVSVVSKILHSKVLYAFARILTGLSTGELEFNGLIFEKMMIPGLTSFNQEALPYDCRYLQLPINEKKTHTKLCTYSEIRFLDMVTHSNNTGKGSALQRNEM